MVKIEKTRPAGNKPKSYTAQPGETIVHVKMKLTGSTDGEVYASGSGDFSNPARDVGGITFHAGRGAS